MGMTLEMPLVEAEILNIYNLFEFSPSAKISFQRLLGPDEQREFRSWLRRNGEGSFIIMRNTVYLEHQDEAMQFYLRFK